MTPTILAVTLALCLALALAFVTLALYLHLLGRQLADVSQRLHLARRGLATADDAPGRSAWRTEIGHLETEAAIIRDRIRRLEKLL